MGQVGCTGGEGGGACLKRQRVLKVKPPGHKGDGSCLSVCLLSKVPGLLLTYNLKRFSAKMYYDVISM